jgi:hypothetical protein
MGDDLTVQGDQRHRTREGAVSDRPFEQRLRLGQPPRIDRPVL